MTPNYAKALVQRYMRASALVDDDSDSLSSPSLSPSSPPLRGKATMAQASSATGAAVPRPSKTRIIATSSVTNPDRHVIRSKSAADSLGSRKQAVAASNSIQQSSASTVHKMVSTARATIPSAVGPASSAATVQHMSAQHSGVSASSNQPGIGLPPRSSSTPLRSSRAIQSRHSYAGSTAAGSAASAMLPPASHKRRSSVDAKAAEFVASYYPGFNSPPQQSSPDSTGTQHRASMAKASDADQIMQSTAMRSAVGNAANRQSYRMSQTFQLSSSRASARELAFDSLPAGWQSAPVGSNSQPITKSQSDAADFQFPAEQPVSPDVGNNPRRASTSLIAWQGPQQHQHSTAGPAAVQTAYQRHGLLQAGRLVSRAPSISGVEGDLSQVPPSHKAPPMAALSPESSALLMAAQQAQAQAATVAQAAAAARPPAAQLLAGMLPAPAFAQGATFAAPKGSSALDASDVAPVNRQLRDVTNSAAAAIARARSLSAAVAATVAPELHSSGNHSSSMPWQQQQQDRDLPWGRSGSPGMPPPDTQLAKEAVRRLSSPVRGSTARGTNQSAGGGSEGHDDVDDDALRGIPGYGDGSRRSHRQHSTQQQHQQAHWQQNQQAPEGAAGFHGSPRLRKKSSVAAEATAAAGHHAEGMNRQSSQQLPAAAELATGVIAQQILAFAAVQAAAMAPEEASHAVAWQRQQQPVGFLATAAGRQADQAALLQRAGNLSLAATRQQAVVTHNGRQRPSVVIAQQTAAARDAYGNDTRRGRHSSQQQPRAQLMSQLGARSADSSSSSSSDNSDSDRPRAGLDQGQHIWRQLKRHTRQGWFQSPDHLRRDQQQQLHEQTAIPFGRYLSPTRPSRWAPWYNSGSTPQQQPHQSNSSMRPNIKLPTISPDMRAEADSKLCSSNKQLMYSQHYLTDHAGRRVAAAAALPGQEMLPKLVREIISQQSVLQAQSDSSSSGSGSNPGSSSSKGRVRGVDSLQFAEPIGRAQQQQEQQWEQKHQQMLATRAAALQAAFCAASPERLSGRTSPEVAGTAIEAAAASAAAAEVARHVQQRKQQASGSLQGSTRASVVPASLLKSPELRRQGADEQQHKARLHQMLLRRAGSSASNHSNSSIAAPLRGRRPSTAGPIPALRSRSVVAGRRYSRPQTNQGSTVAAAQCVRASMAKLPDWHYGLVAMNGQHSPKNISTLTACAMFSAVEDARFCSTVEHCQTAPRMVQSVPQRFQQPAYAGVGGSTAAHGARLLQAGAAATGAGYERPDAASPTNITPVGEVGTWSLPDKPLSPLRPGFIAATGAVRPGAASPSNISPVGKVGTLSLANRPMSPIRIQQVRAVIEQPAGRHSHSSSSTAAAAAAGSATGPASPTASGTPSPAAERQLLTPKNVSPIGKLPLWVYDTAHDSSHAAAGSLLASMSPSAARPQQQWQQQQGQQQHLASQQRGQPHLQADVSVANYERFVQSLHSGRESPHRPSNPITAATTGAEWLPKLGSVGAPSSKKGRSKSSGRSADALIPVGQLVALMQALQQAQQAHGHSAMGSLQQQAQRFGVQSQYTQQQQQQSMGFDVPAIHQQQRRLTEDVYAVGVPTQQQHGLAFNAQPEDTLIMPKVPANAGPTPPRHGTSVEPLSAVQQSDRSLLRSSTLDALQHSVQVATWRSSSSSPSQTAAAAAAGSRVQSPGPQELSSMVAGVVRSVQGLDTLLTSLLQRSNDSVQAAAIGSNAEQAVCHGATAQSAKQPVTSRLRVGYSISGSQPTASTSPAAAPATAAGTWAADDDDTVNFGSVQPVARARGLAPTADITPQQWWQSYSVLGALQQDSGAISAQSSPSKAQQLAVPTSVAGSPVATLSAAAAIVRKAMDQLRSSTLAAWQQDMAAEEQQPAAEVTSRSLLESLPASSPVTSVLTPNRVNPVRPLSPSASGAVEDIVQQSSGLPHDVLLQLAALEAQLHHMQQQMLQHEVQGTAAAVGEQVAEGIAVSTPQGSIQQQLQEQLLLLHDCLQGLLPCGRQGSSTGAASHVPTAAPSAAAVSSQGQPKVNSNRNATDATDATVDSPLHTAANATSTSPLLGSSSKHTTIQQQQPTAGTAGKSIANCFDAAQPPAAAQAISGTSAPFMASNSAQVPTESQLALAKQLQELHNMLGSTTVSLQDMHQRINMLETLQQGSNGGKQLHQADDQNNTSNMLLQQVTEQQQMMQRQLLDHHRQVQSLQEQHTSIALKLETQAAAVATAAATAAAAGIERQLVPLTDQLQQLRCGHQELLEGSGNLDENASMRDRLITDRFNIIQGQLVQQQEQLAAATQLLSTCQTGDEQQQGLADLRQQQEQHQQQAQAINAAQDQQAQQLDDLQQWRQQQQQQWGEMLQWQDGHTRQLSELQLQVEKQQQQCTKLQQVQDTQGQQLVELQRQSGQQQHQLGSMQSTQASQEAQLIELQKRQVQEKQQSEQQLQQQEAQGQQLSQLQHCSDQQHLQTAEMEQRQQQQGEQFSKLAGKHEQLQRQLHEVQEWQQQQQSAMAAAYQSDSQMAAQTPQPVALKADAMDALQQQVQQLELKVAQLQVQQVPGLIAQAAAAVTGQDVADASVVQLSQVLAELQKLWQSVQQLQQQQREQRESQAVLQEAFTATTGGQQDANMSQTSYVQQRQLAELSARVDHLTNQVAEVRGVAGITLPLRLSEVEERVTATAQTCADAVKVIALKHASISSMFAELQAAQAAADQKLQALTKQLSIITSSRSENSRASTSGSRAVGTTGVQLGAQQIFGAAPVHTG